MLLLGLACGAPITLYWLYHSFTPLGVMHNHKSGSGAYLYGIQNIMYRPTSQTAVWRPEIELKEQSASLFEYTKRIEAKKAAGEKPEGRLPSNWH